MLARVGDVGGIADANDNVSGIARAYGNVSELARANGNVGGFDSAYNNVSGLARVYDNVSSIAIADERYELIRAHERRDRAYPRVWAIQARLSVRMSRMRMYICPQPRTVYD